jgi:hypothetical protein
VVKAIRPKQDTQGMASPNGPSLWFGTAYVQPRISVRSVVKVVLSFSANFRDCPRGCDRVGLHRAGTTTGRQNFERPRASHVSPQAPSPSLPFRLLFSRAWIREVMDADLVA